jgi:hypothetical protein
MNTPTKQADALTLAAKAAAIWFIKYCDYGDESINWQNGECASAMRAWRKTNRS